MRLGAPELIVLLAILLLLFGAGRLPQLARSLRKAKDEFENPSPDPTDEKSE